VEKAIDKACLLWHEWRYGYPFKGTTQELWDNFNSWAGGNGNPYRGVLYEYLQRIADDRTRKLEEIREICDNGGWYDNRDDIIETIDEEYSHTKHTKYVRDKKNRKT
jgi:hypothetical protein